MHKPHRIKQTDEPPRHTANDKTTTPQTKPNHERAGRNGNRNRHGDTTKQTRPK